VSAVHDQLEKPQLTLGFIPLTDCAPLVIAKEKGYFAHHGLEVTLSKETSWANIRDKVALGILDGAQMLAPMVLGMSCGVGPVHKPMLTGLSLDLNGNAITVANGLYAHMCQLAPQQAAVPAHSAHALRKVIEARRAAGAPPLTFATVFPTATHTYELRYWMAAAGIDPDRDVRLVVIPPPQMRSRLETGEIDGFCVGEPWNAATVHAGLGRTLITKYELWNNSPEKVFGVTQEWAEQYPNTHRAVVMALLEAARWLDVPAHRREAVALIAHGQYVHAPEEMVAMSMTGTYRYAADEPPRDLPDFNVFYRYAANFPWRSHAVWFLTQMVRWQQLKPSVDFHAVAEAVYRPEIYRDAAARLGIAAPNIDYKTEGDHTETWLLDPANTLGSDAFFDGRHFDPHDPFAYLAGFAGAHDANKVVPLRPRCKGETS
jgi:nitrate/nitrite transport system substrate-binding protein